MALRLTAEEQGSDVLVRKDDSEYRIFPISDAALRWLKSHSPHAVWSTVSGREAITTSRNEARHLIAEIRRNDFQVRGGCSW